jgi:hypothetical protein
LAKNLKAAVVLPESKDPGSNSHPQTPKVRAMSLERAKKIIHKMSAEHNALFRRLPNCG